MRRFIEDLAALDVDDVLALAAITVFSAIVLLYAAVVSGAL